MTRLTVLVLIAGASLAASGMLGAAQATESRAEAYREFRTLFAAGRYADALPHAQLVVELTATDAAANPDLPSAFDNLAATQLRLHDFGGAQASYARSLELLQLSHGISSPQLVEPLAGLAAALAGQGRHFSAAEFYLRAIAISRRAHGLFNLAQLELLDGLAASYQAVANYEGAERTRRYAVQTAEQNYGVDDPRVSPTLFQLAAWYESRRNYIEARAAFARLAQLASRERGDRVPMTVEALLGIGRMHRLQFTLDPESLVKNFSSVGQVTQQPLARPFWLQKGESPEIAQDGRHALQVALNLLDAEHDPKPGPKAHSAFRDRDRRQLCVVLQVAPRGAGRVGRQTHARDAFRVSGEAARVPHGGHPLQR